MQRAPLFAALLLMTTLAHGTVFMCDVGGRKVYQDKPCSGGKPVDVTPANQEVQSVAAPLQARTANKPAPVSATPSLDIERKFGLETGMTLSQVIKRWGIPDSEPEETRVGNRISTWYSWCDYRAALFVDGRLAQWAAPFPESKRGVDLFTYGEPFIRATQRWGSSYEKQHFTGTAIARGEVRRWVDSNDLIHRWVVVDSQGGGIVGWCEAAPGDAARQPPRFTQEEKAH